MPVCHPQSRTKVSPERVSVTRRQQGLGAGEHGQKESFHPSASWTAHQHPAAVGRRSLHGSRRQGDEGLSWKNTAVTVTAQNTRNRIKRITLGRERSTEQQQQPSEEAFTRIQQDFLQASAADRKAGRSLVASCGGRGARGRSRTPHKAVRT
ncbi:unnamed protein product [Arctogadus glacialis]